MSEQVLQRIEDRLDKMSEVLAVNTQILAEHQRRSAASEGRLAVLEKDMYARDRNTKLLFWGVPVLLTVVQMVFKLV